ncbi:MAG: hypothetical protein JSR45_02205 [Proteobacteria bacterium]|nr:hypothetical protein [Pseudomonadota bacterium]
MPCEHRLLSRRSLILAAPGLVLAAPAFAAVPPSGHLAFAAWRNGKKIGEHRLSFAQAGEDLTVHTEVALSVGLGPITVYRYAHHATEHWRGGRFIGLESRTEATDNRIKVAANRTERGVAIDSSKVGKIVLPPEAAPLTHWNMAMIRPPLFNPQDGKLLKLSASRREETFSAPGLRPQRATHVILAGEMGVDDWYDAAGTWIALRAKAKDGSTVDYRRL